MCGIAGILGHPQAEGSLSKLLKAQIHRGPDSEGRFVENQVALGMRRLSIVDLKRGDQPKLSQDKQVVAFLNGEIYNHQELRKKFSDLPYSCQSDTEVIPHLWAHHQEQTLNLLHGMFALAVWEPAARRLTLARDRLGIKPLWIYEKDGLVAYSSEMKAFAEAGLSLTLSSQALWDYLTHSYIPAPRSPFQEVRLLPPGHLAVFYEKDQKWAGETQRWWALPQSSHDPHPEEAVRIVREQLEQSIQERLMADVPLGCLLSGGLDSAVLTAWATKLRGEPLHTFSVGYHDAAFDERPAAENLARELKCPHHSVALNPADFLTTLDVAVKRSDTLLADQAIVALVPLYDQVKEHVTVVLDGDGADEVFAGYPTVTADQWFRKISNMPAWSRHLLKQASRWLPESKDKASFFFRLERFLRHAHLNPAQAHCLWRNIHSLDQKQRLVQASWHPKNSQDRLGIRAYLEAMEGVAPFSDRSFAFGDAKVWLPDDNLKKVDGQSMGVSVEARVPFLDHRIVETVLPWSLDLKRHYGVKGLVREASRGVLPDFARRRAKASFHLPLTRWFQGPLREEVIRRIKDLGDVAKDYFEASTLIHYVENNQADAYSVLNLLVLESWLRQWPGTIPLSN